MVGAMLAIVSLILAVVIVATLQLMMAKTRLERTTITAEVTDQPNGEKVADKAKFVRDVQRTAGWFIDEDAILEYLEDGIEVIHIPAGFSDEQKEKTKVDLKLLTKNPREDGSRVRSDKFVCPPNTMPGSHQTFVRGL